MKATTKLPLGATLLEKTSGTGDDAHLSVLLAKNDRGLVCWVHNLETDAYIWGHYGAQAETTYRARVARYCSVQ